MSAHVRLAALTAVALAGCTLGDWRSEPRILPEGALLGSSGLVIEIRTEGQGPKAQVFVDGREFGAFRTNELIELDVRALSEGRHTLFARVFDGPYSKDTKVRGLVVDRTPPTFTYSPPPGSIPAGSSLAVAVTFSEPVARTSFLAGTSLSTAEPFPVSSPTKLPTTTSLSSDGLTAIVRLDAPLEDYRSVYLDIEFEDLAGNPGDQRFTEHGEWHSPPTLYLVSAPTWVDDSLVASVSPVSGAQPDPRPVTVSLCPFEPIWEFTQVDSCPSVVLGAAGGEATFDTSALAPGPYHVVARLPGHLPTRGVPVEVLRRSLALQLSASRTLTNGPLRLFVTGSGGFPPALELLAGDRVVFTQTSAPGSGQYRFDVGWDANVPDGDYPLSVRVPDWQVTVTSADVVKVDRTPPVATPGWPAELVLSFGRPITAATFSERVSGTAQFLLDLEPYDIAALPVPLEELLHAPLDPARLPWSDATFQYDLTGLHDAAGNPPEPATAFTAVPVWTGVGGPGALRLAGVPLLAKDAAVHLGAVGTLSELARIALVDSAGQVQVAFLPNGPVTTLTAPGSTGSSLLMNASLGLGDAHVAWIDTSAAGVAVAVKDFADLGFFLDPPEPTTLGASPLRSGSWESVSRPSFTWTEPDSVGARRVRFRDWPRLADPPQPGLPTTAIDAVSGCCVGSVEAGLHFLLAWIDGGTTTPQLALSTSLTSDQAAPSAPWLPLTGSGNVDPSQPASEPALSIDHVAWVEGGRIRAGRVTASGPNLQLVHDDPQSAAGARLPAFLSRSSAGSERILVFVEPGQGGDVIAARRWTSPSGWVAVQPVNTGVVGDVRTLAVQGTVVTWTDAAGHVFARRLNR